MRTVLLASLRSHTRRYAAAAVAVVVGVTFVVVTAALSTATRDGMVSGVDAPYADAGVVVAAPGTDDARRLLDEAAATDADAWLVGWTLQPVSHDGQVLDASVDVGHVADDATGRWQVLEEGRFPETRGEAVADVNAARGAGLGVGDRIRIGTGAAALDVELVGLVDSPTSLGWSSVYLRWDDLARWAESLYVDSVAWSGEGDRGDQETTVRAVAPDAEVRQVDDHVDDLVRRANQGVDVATAVLLLFATIALVVSVLVINNTFSILLAQRLRDLALLRCVGATRRQVLRMVRREALTLGLLASVLGLGLGAAVGHGLVALVRTQLPGTRLGDAAVGPGWYAAALAVGVLATVVASWLPARRATGVSPLAALRPDDGTDPRTGTGRLRIVAGTATASLGVALLVLAVGSATWPPLFAGGALVFGGVLVLGPVLVPWLIRGTTAAVGRALGPPARLAGRNAVRNPRRTAATAASLLVGVTLTTAVLTGMASSRDAVGAEMERQHPVDLAVTATASVPDDLPATVAALPGVAEVLQVPGTTARITGLGRLPVLAAPDRDRDPGAAAVLHADRPDVPAPDRIALPHDELGGDVRAGDVVTVRTGSDRLELVVVGGEGWGTAALVAPATLDRLAPTPTTRALWVRATGGADPEDLAGHVEAVVAPAEVENGLARREYVDLQLDAFTGGVVGLLAIAVVIALVGIANTVGLSVLERAREHALLRALGLTRRQLRRTLAAEAVLLSVAATVLGTCLGVGFAWVAVAAQVREVVPEAPLVLPWGQLALVVAVSGVAGLLAAVLPSRRAARVPPAAGLAVD